MQCKSDPPSPTSQPLSGCLTHVPVGLDCCLNTFVLRWFGAVFQNLMHYVETISETFQQKRQKWRHEAFLVSLSISSKPGRSGLCVMLLLITTQVAFFLQTGALHTRLLFPASSVLIKTQSVVLICSNLHSLAPGTQGGTTYQTAMNSHC